MFNNQYLNDEYSNYMHQSSASQRRPQQEQEGWFVPERDYFPFNDFHQRQFTNNPNDMYQPTHNNFNQPPPQILFTGKRPYDYGAQSGPTSPEPKRFLQKKKNFQFQPTQPGSSLQPPPPLPKNIFNKLQNINTNMNPVAQHEEAKRKELQPTPQYSPVFKTQSQQPSANQKFAAKNKLQKPNSNVNPVTHFQQAKSTDLQLSSVFQTQSLQQPYNFNQQSSSKKFLKKLQQSNANVNPVTQFQQAKSTDLQLSSVFQTQSQQPSSSNQQSPSKQFLKKLQKANPNVNQLGQFQEAKRKEFKSQQPGTSKQQFASKKAFNKPQTTNANPAAQVLEAKSREWEVKMTKTVQMLSKCKAGEEVNIISSQLSIPRIEWFNIKEQIHNDLLRLLTPLALEKLLNFGSSLTGLDFHGSDLDYYVQLKHPPASEDEIRKIISKAAKQARYPGQDFSVLCTIQSARVPIVRFLHTKTKIICDVNFTSKFGYYNSYFIGRILSFDKRIKDLAILLKLWSKSYKLASQMIISNYCLIMLMIFYLQNLDQPMLETIFDNQKLRQPTVLDNKFRWNFYFNDNINKSHNNTCSLRQLLIGFFEFYKDFNYTENMISVYAGKIIPRRNFRSHPDLYAYRQIIGVAHLPELKIDSVDSFIVQDGFELNLNIGIKVKKHVDMFLELAKLSHEKCMENKDKPFSELLIRLFTDIKFKKAAPSEQKNKKKFQMTIHSNLGDLKACQDILTAQDENKVYGPEDQQKFFFDHAVEYTKKFLNEIYLCNVVPEIMQPKNANVFRSRFNVILSIDTVTGRKKMNFKDDTTVESEKQLSVKMVSNQNRIEIDIFIVMSSKDKGKTIDFDFVDKNVSKKSALISFGTFFSINILPALRFYLKKRLDCVKI